MTKYSTSGWRLTGNGCIAWAESLVFHTFNDPVVYSQLNNISYRCDVRYCNSLQDVIQISNECRVHLLLTFGLPVVPLEKLKNAIFVFPSPGRNFLSTNVGCDLNPLLIRSCTFEAETSEHGSNTITRSAEIPDCFPAALATSNDSGCVTIIQALVTSI